MKFYQLCFTRLDGRDVGSGWQVVNESPELPTDAVAAYSRIQNGNVIDTEIEKQTEVTELLCAGDYVFYTKILYPVRADDLGRQIMFSHSFAFDKNEFAHDPEAVLGLDESNFRFDVQSTAEVPSSLVINSPLTLKECADSLGLTCESYIALVECVYAILDGKTDNTLHVVCDISDDTVRKYMSCIYAALPFEFRKKVSFSTNTMTQRKDITVLFSENKPDNGAYYIIPSTKENNIISASESLKKRISKYDFIRYVPNNYQTVDDTDKFFHTLEEKLSLFGSAQTLSLDLYKIAYDLYLDDNDSSPERTPEMTVRRLNELLSIEGINHPFIDKQIQYTLSDIIDLDIELNDFISEKLCRKLEKTNDEDLIKCGYIYNSRKVSRMGVEDGAKYLFEAYSDRQSESFVRVRELLDSEEKGREILKQLFCTLVVEQVGSDKESIIRFYDETKDLSDRRSVVSALYTLFNRYAESVLTKEKNPDRYYGIMSSMFDELFPEQKANKNKAMVRVIEWFWNAFSFSDIRLSDKKYYSEVELPTDPAYAKVADAFEAIEQFKRCEHERFIDSVGKLLDRSDNILSEKDCAIVEDRIVSACLDAKDSVDATEPDIWLCLTKLLSDKIMNPVDFLIENRIPAFTENFEEAYYKSEWLKNEDYRNDFVGYSLAVLQRKEESAKVASEILRVIKDDEKRIKQEQRKQVIGEKIDSIGSLIGGIFKKKKDGSSDEFNDDYSGGH